MIKLHNSLSGKKESFKAIKPKEVGMYNCGPTVYDYVHIGNLRSYICADIYRRVFEFNGYSVRQVINITDVGHLTDDGDHGEDKVEKRARERKKTASEITEFFTEAFFEDMEALNIKTDGTLFPKATEHIEEQLDLIKKLEDKGFTYKTSDGVYFNTSKLPTCDFFKVAGEQLKQGARVEINSEKHCPTDFALWKLSPLGERRQQEWDSPWGVGFPGWHLECSAMAIKYLGEQFDIHSGGIDHKFPHHPNEIAQSETATGKKPFVRYWLHNEFLSYEGSKMAKSTGNFATLKDITEKGYSPLVFRFWLLGAHYRTPVNFSWQALRGASNAYEKLIEYVRSLYKEEVQAPPEDEYMKIFLENINNDFDTPSALALMWKLIKDKKVKKDVKLSTLKEFDKVLAIGLSVPPGAELDIPNEVAKLIEKREEARAREDWKESDKLRSRVEELGFMIKDTPEGPKVKRLKQ